MPERRRTEENIEDVQRISDILNRRMKKSNVRLGPRAITKKKVNKNNERINQVSWILPSFN